MYAVNLLIQQLSWPPLQNPLQSVPPDRVSSEAKSGKRGVLVFVYVITVMREINEV
jgi:hypothetical protein